MKCSSGYKNLFWESSPICTFTIHPFNLNIVLIKSAYLLDDRREWTKQHQQVPLHYSCLVCVNTALKGVVPERKGRSVCKAVPAPGISAVHIWNEFGLFVVTLVLVSFQKELQMANKLISQRYSKFRWLSLLAGFKPATMTTMHAAFFSPGKHLSVRYISHKFLLHWRGWEFSV